jgi:hypothetical protein
MEKSTNPPPSPAMKAMVDMIIDLYVGQLAIMDLMRSQGVGMPEGYVKGSQDKVRSRVESMPSVKTLREELTPVNVAAIAAALHGKL